MAFGLTKTHGDTSVDHGAGGTFGLSLNLPVGSGKFGRGGFSSFGVFTRGVTFVVSARERSSSRTGGRLTGIFVVSPFQSSSMSLFLCSCACFICIRSCSALSLLCFLQAFISGVCSAFIFSMFFSNSAALLSLHFFPVSSIDRIVSFSL